MFQSEIHMIKNIIPTVKEIKKYDQNAVWPIQ